MSNNAFGFTTTDSTSKAISVVAKSNKDLVSVVGRMVYMDTIVDNDLYRSIGTITDIKTINPGFNIQYEAVAARNLNPQSNADLRKLSFNIQATFRKDSTRKKWEKHSSALPTSPSTLSPVEFLTEEIVAEMTESEVYPTVGYFRGMGSAPQPLMIPDFGGNTGSAHSAVIGKSGSGKDLALDTLIPTPTGWTTMGELKAGDYVLSENGEPIKVLKAHEILTNSICYKVSFSDGSSIIAGEGHLWYTETESATSTNYSEAFFSSATVSALRKLADEVDPAAIIDEFTAIKTIETLSQKNVTAFVTEAFGANHQKNFSELLNEVAEKGSQVTHGNKVGSVKTTKEILESLKDNTHFIPTAKSLTLPEKHLRHNKAETGALTLPEEYLRASHEQRAILLKGILHNLNKNIESDTTFSHQNKELVYSTQKLLITLGYVTEIVSSVEESQTLWSVSWGETVNQNRYIVSIEQVETVPTRCITVDSLTALYLAGETFIPTHNTAFYTYVLSTFMSHEHHAILVMDPQGQWANENGMVMSAQKFAKGLGRQVNVLRVSEDIKLPMNEEIFTRMLTKLRLWSKFRRMGSENLEAFSDAVASRIARHRNFDDDPRVLLAKVFSEVAYSESALSRIYTKGERRDDFKRDLLMLAGEPLIDLETGEQEVLSAEEKEDVEENWNNILSIFRPLINLFASTNIAGKKRKPLGGEYGFLRDVFQIRSESSGPAPYVVLDMSPSVELHAKADLMGNTDVNLNMQKILDNQDVKALIIMMLLDEMKKASEIAFAQGGGNLNTQIVFDEAWRFAPEGKASPEIEELASMLEGFALDTRKFGIGWTYILQSPADLKYGIWKQLTYVYVGYGLVGEDIKRLEALTDDSKQLDLYRQFIPPKSTGIYPFMLMGPISPIIFTTAPAFVNVFNDNQDFLHYNRVWIERITSKNSLPNLTLAYLTQDITKKEKFTVTNDVENKSFKVGKDAKTVKVQPQISVKTKIISEVPKYDDGLDEMPF